MKFQLKKSEESVILTVFIQNSSLTTGAGLGSLIHTSSIVGGYLKRNGTGVALAVDEDVTTEGTYQAPSAAGKVRIGTPANMTTGTYELHFHNDLFTTADWVTITLGGAANMAPLLIEIQLTDVDLNTALASSTIGTCTTNTDMVGTAGAALASVVGALNDAAAAGDPTTADTLMQYVKQLVNVLVGTDGVTAFPSEAAPANAVNLAEVIRAIYVDSNAIQVKLPSSTYLKGSADADGGMDTNDKTDLESAVDAGMDNVPSGPTANSRDARLESAGSGAI